MQRLGCVIVLLTCCSLVARSETAPNLKTVLERAQNYVATYEQQLGTVIAEEDYWQKAIWEPIARGALRSGGRTLDRHLSSDFLLVRVGETWFGVRNVLRVNRTPVDSKRTDFSDILSEQPTSIIQHLREIQANNTRYNIGDFVRTINVPTFPLTVLERANFKRFSFEKGPQKKFDNTVTWEVRFTEVAHPTMIRDLQEKDQIQRGRLWIDPQTGRVFGTETRVEVKSADTRFTCVFVVNYKQSPKLNMLVPDSMRENYDSQFHHVEGIATYSNFRRFETDVKLNIDPID